MVEIAAILVEVDEHHRRGPHALVGCQGFQHAVDHVGAGGRRIVRVFRRGRRRNHPGDLRQRAVQHIVLDRGGHVLYGVAGCRRHRSHAVVVQSRAGLGIAVLREPGQRIVVEVVARILVHLPGDASRLQPFGVGGPGKARFAVGRDRSAAGGVRVDHAAPQVEAVRIGRPQDRAEIIVADGEGIGQRVVERQVAARVIAHGERGLGRHPVVVFRVVPGAVRGAPAMVEVGHALGAGDAGVEVERQLVAAARRLLEDAVAVAQQERGAVVEAAHALQRAEVVVEGAVFLHENHNMLDGGKRIAGRRGGQRGPQGAR